MKIPEIEAERQAGRAARTVQPRRARRSGPQFASKPLVPETINPFLSRFVAAEDRSELRAKINIRNAALASSSSSLASSSKLSPTQALKDLPFTSTSQVAPAISILTAAPVPVPLPVQPARQSRFSFNFRVQH